MNARNILLVLCALILAGFIALNWSAITAPTDLDFAFTHVNAPLGIVLLGALLVLTLVYLVFGLALRTSLLLDQRSVLKELEATRRMADDAEASRIAGLHKLITDEFAKLHTTLEEDNDWLRGVLAEGAVGRGGFDSPASTSLSPAVDAAAGAAGMGPSGSATSS